MSSVNLPFGQPPGFGAPDASALQAGFSGATPSAFPPPSAGDGFSADPSAFFQSGSGSAQQSFDLQVPSSSFSQGFPGQIQGFGGPAPFSPAPSASSRWRPTPGQEFFPPFSPQPAPASSSAYRLPALQFDPATGQFKPVPGQTGVTPVSPSSSMSDQFGGGPVIAMGSTILTASQIPGLNLPGNTPVRFEPVLVPYLQQQPTPRPMPQPNPLTASSNPLLGSGLGNPMSTLGALGALGSPAGALGSAGALGAAGALGTAGSATPTSASSSSNQLQQLLPIILLLVSTLANKKKAGSSEEKPAPKPTPKPKPKPAPKPKPKPAPKPRPRSTSAADEETAISEAKKKEAEAKAKAEQDKEEKDTAEKAKKTSTTSSTARKIVRRPADAFRDRLRQQIVDRESDDQETRNKNRPRPDRDDDDNTPIVTSPVSRPVSTKTLKLEELSDRQRQLLTRIDQIQNRINDSVTQVSRTVQSRIDSIKRELSSSSISSSQLPSFTSQIDSIIRQLPTGFDQVRSLGRRRMPRETQ